MLGEVILDSEDVNTVGAVMEVGLSMVIVLVIRSRSRTDFSSSFCQNIFSILRPILHKPGLTRVLSGSKITRFGSNSELFRKVICTPHV